MTGAGTRLGRIGEQIAARHLERSGMQVLDRNWRCQVDGLRGELDLIARDGADLVFCEVKTRRGPTPAGPLEGITPAKLRQLRRLAGVWLDEHRGTPSPPGAEQPSPQMTGIRLDAVGVHWPAGGGGPVVTHLRGIDR